MTKWNDSSIRIEAKKYKHRSDFRRYAQGAAVAAKKLGIFEQICSHMTHKVSRFLRSIYAIEFMDKSVYVGLTYNLTKRMRDHFNRPSNKFIADKIRNNISFKIIDFKILLPPEKALEEEHKKKLIYLSNGWSVLNIMKTGKGASLGGHISKYSFDALSKLAASCKSRTELAKKNRSAYSAAREHGWLDSIFTHVPKRVIRKSYWTEDLILNESLKYSTRNEFCLKSRTAYGMAKRLGILDKVCDHMYDYRIWNEESIKKEALKYIYKSDFRRLSGGAYCAMRRLKLDKKVCGHMVGKPNSGRFKSKTIC